MEYNTDQIRYEIAQKYHIPESQIDDALLPMYKMIDTVISEQKKINRKYISAIVLMVIYCTSLLLGLWLYLKK